MYDILLKFSLLNNFGASYTLRNIDEENYIELQMLQLCLVSSAKAQEWAGKRAYHSKEFS